MKLDAFKLILLASLCTASARAVLPAGSTLDSTNQDESRLQLVTDSMGFGWWPADATTWDNIYLTDFSDYLVADGTFTTLGPSQRYEKAGADILTYVGFTMPELGGANAVRNQPLTFFSFDDGADDFFDAYSESDYFGVSWVGGSTEDSAMEWRVDAGAQPYQVIHWWNHGLGEKQTVTVTLRSADGGVRATSSAVFTWPGNTTGNTGFTSFITVHPVAATDYVVIRHNGTNVGWRATAIYYTDEPVYSLYPLQPDSEGNHYDDTFGSIRVIDPAIGVSPYLGLIHVAGYPWIYQAGAGWLFHADGDFQNGLHLYSPGLGWLYVNGAHGGYYYRYATEAWARFP